jgi:hypothetical protein
MYTDIKGCILNNGWVPAPFMVFRGIRQGFPASALIFVFAVEIMAIKLRETKQVKVIEIKLNNTTGNLQICQLADDTILFLKSKHEITIAMNIIEEFGNLSGLKLNKNKTEGIWLGRLKHTRDKYENISWTNDPVKNLAVYFGYNKTQCDKLNYEKQIKKCKGIIKNWNQRNFSLIGRITVFKSLILPNMTFIGSCTIIPKEYIQIFKNIVYELLWRGKKDPVKRSVLSYNYLEGGLKMTNIDTFIKALHIKLILRILENSNENWKIIPQKYFENLPLPTLLRERFCASPLNAHNCTL